MKNQNSKISFVEKLGYGLGDTASNLFFQTFMIFLLYFYTDVFGISAAIAGTMFVVTRIWDTINDPIMGILSDRTSTRWGKFRPYILWLAIPFGFLGVIMFSTPNFGMLGKIIYAYITYSFMMMIYTAINIPYSALMGVMSPNSLVRTSLSSFRFVCAFGGALIIQSATMPLIDSFGMDKTNMVTAEVQDNKIVINELSAGEAKLKVVAIDSEGKEVETDFHINVRRNEFDPPKIVQAIKDTTLNAGFGELRVDYSETFLAKQDKKYKYKISSNNSKVAKAELDKKNQQIVIKERGKGQTKIKLSAIDKRWGDVNSTFIVRVLEPGNKLPIVKQEVPDLNLKKGFTSTSLNLSEYISDDAGDKINFTAISTNSSVVAASIKENQLLLSEQFQSENFFARLIRKIFTSKKPEKGTGYTEIVIAANDGKGGIIEETFSVVVSKDGANPPFLKSKPTSVNLNENFGSTEVAISDSFIESDNGNLTYKVTLINEKKGFTRTMLLFAIVASLMFLFTFFTTKERVNPPLKERTPLKNDLKDLANNKPWIVLFFVGIFTLSWVSIHLGTTVYYFKYFVGDESKVSLFLVVGSIFNILGVMSTKYISKFFGKKKLYFICMLGQSLLLGMFYFAGPNDILLMYALHIPAAFLSGPTQPLVWAMYADTADYSEWKTNRRATGLVFSAATFAQKMGWTIGGALTGWILAYYGFVANEIQSPETQQGIRVMKTIYPMIGGILASVTVLFYNLDEKLVKKIQDELEKRRGTLKEA